MPTSTLGQEMATAEEIMITAECEEFIKITLLVETFQMINQNLM